MTSGVRADTRGSPTGNLAGDVIIITFKEETKLTKHHDRHVNGEFDEKLMLFKSQKDEYEHH